MISVLVVMISGIIAGILIHRKPNLIKINDKLISLAIYLLLLLLGISVGLNKTIVQNIGTLGLQAIIITFGAVLGSVVVSWLVFPLFFSSKASKELNNEE